MRGLVNASRRPRRFKRLGGINIHASIQKPYVAHYAFGDTGFAKPLLSPPIAAGIMFGHTLLAFIDKPGKWRG